MKLAAVAALTWCATAAADPRVDVTSELRAIGVRRARELAASAPTLAGQEIAAAGPCIRPTAVQREAITTTVDAWIGRTNPGSHPSAELDLAFGCVDRAGVVVDAQQDLSEGDSSSGHWWILRVNNDRVDELATVTGTALGSFMEFASESTITTVVLADIDHDGVLDVVARTDDREGGSNRHDGTLSLILSSTRHAREIADVGGDVTAAAGATADLVLAITENNRPTAYRCVEANASLSRCPDAERARRFAAAVAVAGVLARTGSSDSPVPTRDDLATELDAVGVIGPDRDRLLAAVSPTPAAHHAMRRIEAALASTDDRTQAEQIAERLAYFDQLHAALGDERCTDGTASEPTLDKWLVAHAMDGGQVLTRCVGPAGRYYFVQRADASPTGDTLTRAVLFVAGNVTTELATTTTPLAGQEQIVDPDALPLDAMFYRHGAALIAIALDGPKQLSAFVDGRPIAKRTGELARFTDTDGVPFDALIVDHSPAGAFTILHVTDRIRPIEGKAAALIAARSAAAAARTLLAGLDDAALVQYRDQVAAALRVIGADPTLVAEVRRLAKP